MKNHKRMKKTSAVSNSLPVYFRGVNNMIDSRLIDSRNMSRVDEKKERDTQ